MLKKYSPAQQKAILTRELVFALSLLLLFFFSGKFLLNLDVYKRQAKNW